MLIPEWGRPHGFEDLAIDSQSGRLYASSANMEAILVFDLNGNRIGTMKPTPSNKLEGASASVIADRKLYVVCTSANHVVQIQL
jgi:hypothetical protein